MPSLKKREDKIKEKRKQTKFRDFVKEIVSWYPFILHKRDGLITRFPKTNRVKNIISTRLYEENRENLIKKGRAYNFKESFFDNFKQLHESIDFFNIFSFESENCEYWDNIYNAKNCYLSNGVIHECENILYSFYIKQGSKNIFNSVMVWDNCENIYFASGILKSYNIFYSKYIYNSSDIWFSSNLTWCSHCILSDSLENKSYYIQNKAYSKEAYFKRKNEILKDKDFFLKAYKKLNPIWKNIDSKNCSWIFSVFCENTKNSFYSYRVKNWRNIILMWSINWNENFYDCFAWWSPKWDNYYGCNYIGTYSENAYMSMIIDWWTNIYYSYNLTNCSFCIGCIWIRNKSYCILNKQYSKEEWYKLVDIIFREMEKEGTLWNFFPGRLNPFYFNDTVSCLIDDSFTKSEVEKEGFMWRDEKIKVDIPEWSKIVYTNPPILRDIPLTQGGSQSGVEAGGLLSDYQGFDSNGNWQIDPEILKKVIVDTEGNYYKIIKQEYDFLMKYGLPLPELHWLERIRLGFRLK